MIDLHEQYLVDEAGTKKAVVIPLDVWRGVLADMEELRGDASRLTAATGWQPAIPFDDTLKSLLDDWDARVA